MAQLTLGAHTHELIRIHFWNKSLSSEESVREFSELEGLEEALISFSRVKLDESNQAGWECSDQIAAKLLETVREMINQGAAAVHAVALISLLDQLKSQLEE